MARLFTCGFEEEPTALTATAAWDAAHGTNVSVVTTSPHSGTYHLRIPGASSQAFGPRRDLATSKTSGTLWLRIYWNPATLPSSGTITSIFRAANSATGLVWQIYHTRADNTLSINNNIAGTTATTTATVSASTWYRLEVAMVVHASAGSLELRLYEGDSTSPLDTKTLNGSGSGEATISTNVRQFYPGSSASVNQGQVWWFDDIAINDESGSFQTSWVGPGKTFLVVPAEDSTPLQWTPLSGTDHFEMVNDLPGTPDDDTSYVSTSTTNNEEWFYPGPAPAEVPANATLVLADTCMRAEGNATTPDVQVGFWDNTTTTWGATRTLTSGSYTASTTASHAVASLAGKTKSQVAGFNIGCKLLSAEDCRVTAIWTNIEWLESAVTNTNITVPTTVYSGP